MAEAQHASDLIIIGGGPGGYVAAIRAAQLGMTVSLVERETLGGVCLNWGCIPTKALLRNAEVYQLMQRGDEFGLVCDNLRVDFAKVIQRSRHVADRLSKGVAFLMRKNKIQLVQGLGRLAGAGVVGVQPQDGAPTTLRAPHIILATGARPRELPGLPFTHPHVVNSTEAMVLSDIPNTLTIIGAGAIGVEFAYLYNAFGSKVTLVETLPQILPQEDEEISQALHQSLTQQGIEILVDSRLNNAGLMTGGVRLQLHTPIGERTVESAKVLVAIGVQGNIENLGLDAAGGAPRAGFYPSRSPMPNKRPRYLRHW